MNNLFTLLKKYNCIDVHIDIIGIVSMSIVGDYGEDWELERPLPFSDFVYIDDFPTLMNTLNEFAAGHESHMFTHFRMESGGELHWSYLCCHKSAGSGFDGVLLDVYEYLECIPNDDVINEFITKQENKISVFNNNSASLEEIFGREYLQRMQQPFAGDPTVYSVIYDDRKSIVAAADEMTERDVSDYLYSISKPIKVNFKASGEWTLYSNSMDILDRNEPFLTGLADSLSKIANSYIALYNEAENSRAVNRQLGANVEQQMLINNMQSVIMEEPRARDALDRVLETAGKYLKLDILTAFEINKEAGKPYLFCQWGNTNKILEFAEFIENNYESISTDLGETENYFSFGGEDKFNSIGITAFAVSKVIDNVGRHGLIIYAVCGKERKWDYNDRKIIRSVSQVLSSIIFRCKTERQIEEKNEQLYRLAFFDSMLGIKNRAKLDADLAEELQQGKSGIAIAVQILNTRFLNEVFGQSYTDKLLRLVADCLTDKGIGGQGVYRYSGSIMMIIIPGCIVYDAQLITKKILNRFKLPFYIDGVEQFAEAAIGITVYNNVLSTCEDIYRAATLSLYRATEYGKNAFAFYNQEFLNARGVAYNLESELRRSIANNMHNFTVTFQPSIDINNEIDHYETLLRWKSEKMGVVSPKVFMRLMEKVGLDASIDFWVLPKACKFCKKISDLMGKDIRVSINLTTHEMQTGALPTRIQSAIADAGIKSSQLIVEVPEAAHVLAYNDTASTLGRLKKFGVNICIDSFGNEYLPLNVMKNSYVDMIKVSSSFVTNSGGEFDDVILSTTFSLAASQGITICVKNIEYRGQYDVAQSAGADLFQGGINSFPLSEEEIYEKIRNSSTAAAKSNVS